MKRGLDGDPSHRAPAARRKSFNLRDVAAHPRGRCFRRLEGGGLQRFSQREIKTPPLSSTKTVLELSTSTNWFHSGTNILCNPIHRTCPMALFGTMKVISAPC